jgi:two-component system nitrogen regulation sensor histidine kinase NtrY
MKPVLPATAAILSSLGNSVALVHQADAPDRTLEYLSRMSTAVTAAEQPVEIAAAKRPSRVLSIVGASSVALALLSALATFLVLAGMAPIPPNHDVVVLLFIANAVLILVLVGVVVGEALRLIKARRAGLAASGLHARIVGLFAFVAALPGILVAVVGWITLERGLDLQFSRYIKDLLTTSVDVANGYRELQCRAIGREINLMAADLSRARPALDQNRPFFRDFMRSRSVFLGFPVAMLIKSDLSVVERIELKPLDNLPMPTPEDIQAAADLEAWCLVPNTGNVFRALLKVPAFDDTYLLVARQVDPKALAFPQQAAQAAAYYDALEQRKLGVQVAFASMYALISLILLLSAVWLGLNLANRLVAPIRRLIHATDQVALGNFYVQVPVRKSEGDLGHLGETFNKMTTELRQQHDRLVAANEVIDSRRRFTEAVLSGVSAGVIGIDGDGVITVLNPSAERVLGAHPEEWVGRPVTEAIPELGPLLVEAAGTRQRLVQGQITIMRGGKDRILTVRLTGEQAPEGERSFIITLDDITDLVSAQRTSAWADVARRIAHEIKNPLTPIQLSAERIKRKYGKVITTDREIFEQCTNTIVRQVDDIKRMVDEFSSFARMPKPRPEDEDVADVVRQVVFLMKVGSPEIEFDETVPKGPLQARFDRRLISQAVTNIVKNATESVAAVPEEERGQGRIKVSLEEEAGGIVAIEISDNGKGFPTENRQRLLEPYMTTREGGTGLGLAIVGKILEEHGGGIELLDNPDVPRGARVRLWFPKTGQAQDAEASFVPPVAAQ